MRLRTAALIGVIGGICASGAFAQSRPADVPTPVVRVSGPSVIAFWRVPASDSVLEADPGLASALDDQQYYWSETRPLLEARRIAALDQPGVSFVVREPRRRWRFTAAPDSADIGYILVTPGRTPRVLYGRRFPDEILAAARAYFRRRLP